MAEVEGPNQTSFTIRSMGVYIGGTRSQIKNATLAEKKFEVENVIKVQV